MNPEEEMLLVTATAVAQGLLPELVAYVRKRLAAGSTSPADDFRIMTEAADAAYQEAMTAKFGVPK